MIDDVKLGSRGGMSQCVMSRTRTLFQVGFTDANNLNPIRLSGSSKIAIVVAINRLATSSGSLLAHDWPRLLAVLYDAVERPSLWRETR